MVWLRAEDEVELEYLKQVAPRAIHWQHENIKFQARQIINRLAESMTTNKTRKASRE